MDRHPANMGGLNSNPISWHSRAGGGAVHSINSGLTHDERSGIASSACEIYPYPRARSSSRSLSEFCGRARPAPLRLLYVAIAIIIHVAWNASPAIRTN